MFIFL
jgi:E3 ubiquitin-protein ligase RFWD3